MLDTGLRFALSFLPAGVLIIVGIVLAARRRRTAPSVAQPALVGLGLHLLAVLLGSLVLVLLPALSASGSSISQLQVVGGVIGFVVIFVTIAAWAFLLVALFRRLPGEARPADKTPTGRHALLDARGQQVVAEEGASLYPAESEVGDGLGVAAFGTGGFGTDPSRGPDSGPFAQPGRRPTPFPASGPLPTVDHSFPAVDDDARTEAVPVAGGRREEIDEDALDEETRYEQESFHEDTEVPSVDDLEDGHEHHHGDHGEGHGGGASTPEAAGSADAGVGEHEPLDEPADDRVDDGHREEHGDDDLLAATDDPATDDPAAEDGPETATGTDGGGWSEDADDSAPTTTVAATTVGATRVDAEAGDHEAGDQDAGDHDDAADHSTAASGVAAEDADEAPTTVTPTQHTVVADDETPTSRAAEEAPTSENPTVTSPTADSPAADSPAADSSEADSPADDSSVAHTPTTQIPTYGQRPSSALDAARPAAASAMRWIRKRVSQRDE